MKQKNSATAATRVAKQAGASSCGHSLRANHIYGGLKPRQGLPSQAEQVYGDLSETGK